MRAIPSSRERRSPAWTFDRTVSAMLIERDLGDRRDEARGLRPPIELVEPTDLALSKLEDDSGPEILLVLRGPSPPVAIVRRGDGRDRAQPFDERGLKRRHFHPPHRPGPARPEGEHERKTRRLLPELPEVDLLRLAPEVEGRIADRKRRVRRAEHRLDRRREGHVLGL